MSAPRSTILAIDDSEELRRLLEERLRQSHLVKTAPDGDAALALARGPALPDLILLDTKLAVQNGYELCKALRALPGLADVPVIFLAERRDAHDLVQAFRLDAIDFFVKPLSAPTIGADIKARLEQLAQERSARLQGSERRVGRLVLALQWHEGSLAGKRTRRLGEYARALGGAAGAREAACELLMRAAPLHDVGKLGVPAEVLQNERILSGAERELFERHAALGAEIIGEHDDALLKLARTIALTHHERWDGAGYPGRLQANQIPSAGRVMAIVDAFESMTAPQYGGFAISIERAVAEIGKAAGKQFDPALVEALHKALPAFRQVYEAHAEQPADDDIVIGAAADGARRPAAPADDDIVIGAAADGARRPAAPADDDLVIGAAAAGAVDESRLPMIGPLAIPGESASTEGLREAIQPAESSVAAQAHAPAELAAELHRAEQAQLQAQITSLRARVKETEGERAAAVAALSQARAELADVQRTRGAEAQGELARLGREREVAEERHRREQSELHGQLESLRARVKEMEGERAAAATALSQARAELADVQRTRGVEAQGELARLGREREVAEERHRREQSELRGQLESLRARVKEMEGERAAAVAALSQARAELADVQRTRGVEAQGELARLGREREVAEERHRREQSELRGQLESLRARVKEMEGERAAAVAALSQARAELADVQRTRGVEAQGELARLGREREVAEERHRREQSELRGQLESLRARVKEMEGERAASQKHDAEVATAEAQWTEVHAALLELEKRRAAAEGALAQLETATPAQGPHWLVLLVVFLLGGLAVAITFVLGLYYIQGMASGGGAAGSGFALFAISLLA